MLVYLTTASGLMADPVTGVFYFQAQRRGACVNSGSRDARCGTPAALRTLPRTRSRPGARRARAQGINGNKMEKACDLCHITLNKNAVVGDVSALAPGGVRVGAPAMTSRGLVEADFKVIADFLHELVQLCLDVQKQTGKLYKDFEKCGPGIAYNLSRITP